MKNKPQWLIDAENKINQFAETKFGKLSQAKIDQINGGATAAPRYDSNYQSEMGKRGGAKGAAVAKQNLIDKLGWEGYCQWKKENGYDRFSDEKKAEFHKKGQLASAKVATAKKNTTIEKIIEDLPNSEFTRQDANIEDIMVKHGKGKSYFINILKYFPERFELVNKDRKRGVKAIYKKN